MKGLFFFYFLLLPLLNQELPEIRKIYPNAANSEITAKELAAKLTNITFESDKTLIAYKGASITMVSKFSKNLSEKITKFKEGVKWIEFAVANDPNNIEIRFIRLSIQENVPGITKYKKNISEDAAFIATHYKEQTATIKEYLKNFILQSKSFSISEKQTIK
jgi:hypothetical protein